MGEGVGSDGDVPGEGRGGGGPALEDEGVELGEVVEGVVAVEVVEEVEGRVWAVGGGGCRRRR